MHYVHGGGAERAEDGREGEGDGFRDVGFVAFGVGGAGAAAYEEDEIFGAVAAEMNFFHDRGGHVAVDDFADDDGGFFDSDAQRLRDFFADGIERAIFIQALVDIGDGAAAGADGKSLDHGDADHPAINDGAKIVAADAVFDYQSDVEAGAAHVRHDDILVAENFCYVVRAH